MNLDLTKVPTEVLAHELRKRSDLMDSEGVMSPEVFQLVEKVQPIPCVDAVPLRRKKGRVEAMAVRRGTGATKGLLVPIGGRIRYGESMEACIRRHFKTDLGCEVEMLSTWQHPVSADQWVPPKNGICPPDFHPEDTKHAVQNLHVVRQLDEPKHFGVTHYGGQEATGVRWFGVEDMPPASAFGMEHHVSFFNALLAGSELV